jgi:hypothetical protein
VKIGYRQRHFLNKDRPGKMGGKAAFQRKALILRNIMSNDNSIPAHCSDGGTQESLEGQPILNMRRAPNSNIFKILSPSTAADTTVREQCSSESNIKLLDYSRNLPAVDIVERNRPHSNGEIHDHSSTRLSI